VVIFDRSEQLLQRQRERSADALGLPDEPVRLDARKSVVGGPDLDLPRIAVDDPVQRDPRLLPVMGSLSRTQEPAHARP
jgi:hypothetical protein